MGLVDIIKRKVKPLPPADPEADQPRPAVGPNEAEDAKNS